MSWRSLLQSRPARFVGTVARGFVKHDDLSLAAAVAFYTVLSFAPLVLLIVTMGDVLGGSAKSDLVRFFDRQLGPGAGDVAREIVGNSPSYLAGSWRWYVGVALLIVAASGVFAQLQSSLNVIWEAKAPVRRGLWGWLRKRLLSMGMVLAALFILLVSLVLTSVIEHLLPAGEGLPGRVMDFAASMMLATPLFAAIFRVLPDARIAWRQVWLGALTTAGLFCVGRLILGLYFEHGGVAKGYDKAAGALIALLVWVYYSCIIVFVGAEITRHYDAGHTDAHRPGRASA